MTKFIPYEKLSKKEQQKRNTERRNMWQINPVTRKPANSRAYNRKKAQNWKRDSFDFVLSKFFAKIKLFFQNVLTKIFSVLYS